MPKQNDNSNQAQSQKEALDKLDKVSSLFTNEGWKELLEEFEANKQAILNGAIYLDDLKDIHFHRGRLSVYEEMLGLDKVVDQAYRNLENPQDGPETDY